jgi:hypothetical protein
VTLDEVQELLDYRSRSGIFDVVLRNRGLVRRRAQRLEMTVERFGDDLDQAIEAWTHEIVQAANQTEGRKSQAEPKAEDHDWQPPALPPLQPLPTRLVPQPPFRRADSTLPPASEPTTARRTRKRDRDLPSHIGATAVHAVATPGTIEARTPEQIETAKMLMHLMHVFAPLLDGVAAVDRPAVVQLVRDRTSPKRIKDIRDFLDSVLSV